MLEYTLRFTSWE